MGYSYSDTRYSINGALDTSKSVLENLTSLCNAAGTWLTYDIQEGKWSVIINQSGDSIASFDDSNIVGPVSINGTGLYNLYNSVAITYTHEDLKGQKDVLYYDLPIEDRNANEPDNELNLTYEIVTNPVQAQMLGLMELAQSRVDKIITFQTDHSMIHVKAGDLIDVTSDVYGFDQKMFRVITVSEADDTDDTIKINITALEYDEGVYDTTNLSRYIRTDATGIATIGAIDAPDQPEVNKYEQNSRPRIEISTVMNAGIADTMEFWISYDVPPAVTVDANRSYTLLTTAKPKNGANFDPLEQVIVEFDSLSQSEFYVKVRATNGQAASPYSSPSGLITYSPTQITDAIGPDTQAIDENGNLLNIGGLTALLALMDSFFSGNSSSGGSSSGNGTTFLLLGVQSFNGNMTTGGNRYATGSRFVPVVRIVPPGVSSIIEGIDQTSFSQCLVGDGSGVGGYSYPLGSFTLTHWPQYYPHKILQQLPTTDYTPNTANVALGEYETPVYYAVDLGVYKYYYPTATKFELEIRGYWQLEDQEYQLNSTDYSSANISVTDSMWKTTTAGTGNVRVSGAVWTNAKGWQDQNNTSLVPPSWSTQGIGSSANVVVTSTVYPYQLGSNVELSSTGDHITTFSYDFTKQRNKAPKFNPYNFSVPITTTVDVPITWGIGLQGNVIGNVTPASNITISSIPKNIGTTEIRYVTSGPGPGGTYNHLAQKVTRYNGRIDMPYSGFHSQDSGVVFPDVLPVPLTANVFSYNYVRSQSTAVANIGPIYTPTPVTEWYSIYFGKSGQYGNPYLVSDGGDFANANPATTFYSNMSKISTTSTAFVPVNPLNKSIGRANEQYIPLFWGQAKSTANVGATTITSFNWWGAVSNGQYYNRLSNNPFPYIDNTITFPTGLFFNGNAGNATSSINHVAITGNTNANVNADNDLGYWVTGTISS